MSSESYEDGYYSSEPSSTTVMGPNDGNPEAAPRKKVYEEQRPRKRQKSYPIPCIVLLEFILPICYVINSMTTQGVMGIINIIILAANVAITNLTKKSITGHKIILSIELIYNIILLGLASSIGMSEDEDSTIVKIMGLDFDNYVAKDAKLTIGISVVAIILEIVSAILLFKTKPEIMLERRAKIYSSMAWIFASDFIWTFCLAVMGAVQMFMEIVAVSYCFLPLLAYILYISITMGLFGRPFVHQYILIVIYIYAILFSLFIFYTTSPLGKLKPIIKQEDSNKLHESPYFQRYAPLSLAVNVVQIWFSVQLCFVFKRSKPKIPHFLVTLSDILLVFSFVAVLVYSVFFPCYIAGVWELIVFLACFFSLNASRKFFFRVLSVIHNILFSAIYVTCLKMFFDPDDLYKKPVENKKTIEVFERYLQPVGLYHFYKKSGSEEEVNKNKEFMFVLLGFLLTSILAQIGRVVHFKPPKPKENEEEGEGVELRDIIDEPKKEKKKEPGAVLKFIIKIATIVKNIVVFIFKNLSVGAVVVLGLTFGYQENQYCFNGIWAIILITNVLGLFHRPIFYIILFLTGLIIITATVFETMPKDFYMTNPDTVEKISSILERSGLKRAEGEAELPIYLWPYIVMVFLCVLITHMGKVKVIYPSTVVMFIFWALALLHLAYLYVFGPNIFSVIYVITGIFIFYSKVLNKVLLTKIAIIVSGISVSLHLTMLMFSEFSDTRNFLMSVRMNDYFSMEDIVDLREPITPGWEAALLAVTMFCISLTYMNTNPLQKRPSIWIQGIREEFKAVLRSLFFYISWLLMFFFSISNSYPTVIKCVISIFFLLGSKMARFFNKLVGILLYSNTIYIVAEVFLAVFPKLTHRNETGIPYSEYKPIRMWCEYIGLYFVDGDKGQGDRNYSMTWQLLFILVIIVNMIAEHPEPTDPKFDNSLGMRLYRAFYMMLHNWLPVFVNISLCVSTLYNPTIFGFFSLLVLIIVQFKPKVLQRGAVWISVLFNFCFLFQYVIWLGPPPPSRYYYISEYLDNPWGDFLSLRNIEIEALFTNMVTAFMLTFYLQFRELAMNYNAGFNDLPDFLKGVIKFIVSNIFEIIEAVAIAISIFIPTFDGLFFTILISILFYMTLLHDFDNHKTISIHLWGLFLVIAGRLLSRIPYFSPKSQAVYVQQAFGLPFRGNSSTEYLWIILFALESLVIHIMETPMFQECRKDSIQRLAYRFIRVRQLKVLNRINQEVVDSIQHAKIEQIFRLADQQSTGLNRSASLLMAQQQNKKPEKVDNRTEEQKKKDEEDAIRKKAEEEERKKKEAEEKQRIIEEKKAAAAAEGKVYIPEEEEEEEEPPKTIKERILGFWDIFMEIIILPLCANIIEFYSKTVSLNCEAGVNVLTFNSLNSILRRIAAAQTAGGTYNLSPVEQNFLKKLPPSFYMQLGGIGEILQWPEIKPEVYRELLLRYLGYTVRKLSLPCLVLMSVIYTYKKPYLFAFIFTVYIFALFVGTNIYATPLIYRVFYVALIIMLLFRAVCSVDLISEQITKYLNSVSAAQSRISYPDLFGFNSNDSSNVEILMFLVGTWFVVDNLRNANVFAPSHYNNKIFGGDNKLDGYPDKYFYNFDNPDKVLGLSQKKMPSIWQQIVANANNIRIPASNEYFLVMILDVIAFIVMLLNISDWTTPSDSTTSGISIMFVFSLIFSAIFIFIFFLLRISNNFLYLYIFNTIQLICVLIFDFWICYKPKTSSLQFYLFLKYFAILIVYHDTYLGKIIANFDFPDIENSWRKILYLNNFMRICPFVFEIHSLLMWMSKNTRVQYSHFFIKEDVKTLLENQMVYNHRPEQRRLERNLCIGGCFLFLIILLLFGPLFFMVGGSGAYMNNPILSSQLEIGFTAVGSIYRSYAQFTNLTSSEHNAIANSNYSDLAVMKTYSRDDLVVALFPLTSQSKSMATEASIKSFLTNSNQNKRPYVKLTTTFQYPATTAKSNVISYQINMDQINLTQSNDYLEQWKNISTYKNLVSVPVAYFNPRESAATSSSTNYSCGFTFDAEKEIVSLSTSIPNISDLDDQTFLKIVIWSEEVESSGAVGTLVSMGGGIIGIYILIIFTFGEVLRERTLGGYEELWVERMKKPENLYQYIIAIEAFRSVGAIDREYMMMEMFLDVVRSKETCINLTNDPEPEDNSDN